MKTHISHLSISYATDLRLCCIQLFSTKERSLFLCYSVSGKFLGLRQKAVGVFAEILHNLPLTQLLILVYKKLSMSFLSNTIKLVLKGRNQNLLLSHLVRFLSKCFNPIHFVKPLLTQRLLAASKEFGGLEQWPFSSWSSDSLAPSSFTSFVVLLLKLAILKVCGLNPR